jgi:hypothetical protein
MKGQVSAEFMVFISILIVIVSILIWSNLSIRHEMIGIKSNVEAQRLCDKIAFEINSAIRAGDGYKRTFYIEDTLYGVSDFEIFVEEYSIAIDWNSKSVFCNIITKNITSGSIQKDWNTIENINGLLYVS